MRADGGDLTRSALRPRKTNSVLGDGYNCLGQVRLAAASENLLHQADPPRGRHVRQANDPGVCGASEENQRAEIHVDRDQDAFLGGCDQGGIAQLGADLQRGISPGRDLDRIYSVIRHHRMRISKTGANVVGFELGVIVQDGFDRFALSEQA